MTPQEQKLVELITQEVINILRQRGSAPATGQRESRVEVHPPIGTCTGDYSKFPELAGQSMTPASPAASLPATSGDPAPLTGFVTANQLQEAINASGEGIALLSPDAKLTPLANDFVRQHPEKIKRASSLESRPSGGGGSVAASSWLWWIDGACPAAQQVVSERSGQLRAMAMSRSQSSLGQVVRELASSIKAGSVDGGVLFVHNAARAMCFANRCASIRAVVGTCGEAVEQGVNEMGANVLVLEYPHHGHRAMAGMVDRMLQQPPRIPPAVQRELADLHRCG